MTVTHEEVKVDNIVDLFPYEDNDDPNLRAHIVRPMENRHVAGNNNLTGQDIVDIARASQIEIVALCGHKFVPKHNPDKYDACEACMKIAGHIMSAGGE